MICIGMPMLFTKNSKENVCCHCLGLFLSNFGLNTCRVCDRYIQFNQIKCLNYFIFKIHIINLSILCKRISKKSGMPNVLPHAASYFYMTQCALHYTFVQEYTKVKTIFENFHRTNNFYKILAN